MNARVSFAVGDIVVWRSPGRDPVRREITEVRPTGYTWRYPDLGLTTARGGENRFFSEDSNDPFFEIGWTREPRQALP